MRKWFKRQRPVVKFGAVMGPFAVLTVLGYLSSGILYSGRARFSPIVIHCGEYTAINELRTVLTDGRDYAIIVDRFQSHSWVVSTDNGLQIRLGSAKETGVTGGFRYEGVSFGGTTAWFGKQPEVPVKLRVFFKASRYEPEQVTADENNPFRGQAKAFLFEFEQLESLGDDPEPIVIHLEDE